jgi:hypothetical protein
MTMLPARSVGYQDLASYIASRSGADQAWRRHMASSLYPSMRRASFALAQPLQLEEVSPRVVLARLSGAQERAPEARVTGRFDMPVVGAGASRPLVYPVVNRQTKGDLLAERPKVRATIPSPRADAGLLAAPDVLAATSTFVRRPWGEAVNGGDLASTSDLGGAQLAAVRLNDNLSDAAPLARFGLSVPAPDMVEALTQPHSAGDEPDSQERPLKMWRERWRHKRAERPKNCQQHERRSQQCGRVPTHADAPTQQARTELAEP